MIKIPVGIKINVGILKKILQYAELKGLNGEGKTKELFKTCVLSINKKKGIVEIKSLETHKAVIVLINYSIDKANVIGTGDIPIEISKLIKTLNSFNPSDEISLTYSKNISLKREKPKLTKSKRTISTEDVLTNINQELTFKYNKSKNIWTSKIYTYDTYFKISGEQLTELNKDALEIENYSYTFNINKNGIHVTIYNDVTGETSERELSVLESNAESEFEVKYSIGIGNVCNLLKNEVEGWITNEAPMILKTIDDNINIVYVISSQDYEEEDDNSDENDNEEDDSEEADNTLNERINKIKSENPETDETDSDDDTEEIGVDDEEVEEVEYDENEDYEDGIEPDELDG